jgi:hypothetical protein
VHNLFGQTRWNPTPAAILVLFATAFVACNPPLEIAGFADAASKALIQGSSLFGDLHDSCIRRHAALERITPAFLPEALVTTVSAETLQIEKACAPFASQSTALDRQAKALAAYFQAMQQLASFDNSSVSAPAAAAGGDSAAAAQLSFSQIDSISKLSGLVTRAFTGNYRRNRLQEYLREADPHVASLTTGLEDIIGKDYPGLLSEERRNLNIQYQRVFDSASNAAILLLNRAYRDDVDKLKRRQTAAEAFVHALEQIRQGHRELAAGSGRLETRQTVIKLQDLLWQMKQIEPGN